MSGPFESWSWLGTISGKLNPPGLSLDVVVGDVSLGFGASVVSFVSVSPLVELGEGFRDFVTAVGVADILFAVLRGQWWQWEQFSESVT